MARSLGDSFEKGTLFLLFAQGIFFLTNYVIHIMAANTVSASDYGRFGVIMSILGMSYIFLSIGLPESAAKFISEDRDQLSVVRIVLFFQTLFSAFISLLLYLFAESIAVLLNDIKLISYIHLLSILIPIRAIFNVFRSVFQGQKLFRISSYVSLINSVLKMFFSVLLLFLGYKITGILLGYITAALLAMILAIIFSLRNGFKRGKDIGMHELFKFASPLIFLTISLNVILDMDILLIKALLIDSNQVGYYNSAKVISTIPVGLALAFAGTVLPTISKFSSRDEHHEIKLFINKLISYLIIIFLPFCAIISSSSDLVIGILFPIEYQDSIRSLSVLVFSFSLLSVFMVISSVFNGLGKTHFPLFVSFLMIVIYSILSYNLILSRGIYGASLASFFTNMAGVILLMIILRNNYPFVLMSKNNLYFTLPNVLLYFSIILVKPSLQILFLFISVFLIIYYNIIVNSKIFDLRT